MAVNTRGVYIPQLLIPPLRGERTEMIYIDDAGFDDIDFSKPFHRPPRFSYTFISTTDSRYTLDSISINYKGIIKEPKITKHRLGVK